MIGRRDQPRDMDSSRGAGYAHPVLRVSSNKDTSREELLREHICLHLRRRNEGISVASYRSRRQRLAEEVPGLYIRRLTLEDPKTARERPDSGLQLPARHVCHPRASYVPSDRPSSRSWLEQLRRERKAVLTITSLELPDCPIPLIDSQSNKSCRTANSRDNERDETLNEIIARVAEAEAQGFKKSGIDRKLVDEKDEFADEDYSIDQCCRENESLGGTSSGTRIYDENDDENEEEDAVRKSNANGEGASPSDESMCAEISKKLRINIRKKTEVKLSRSPSPEVTHTIRIAMKYQGQRDHQTAEEAAPMAGVSVALDFTLNCNSVQLTSRDVTVRSIGRADAKGQIDSSHQ